MKWSRDVAWLRWVCGGVLVLSAGAMGIRARADLPGWMQYVVAGSAVEAALYRVMELPGVKALYPRPPAEARGEMDALVKAKPDAAELYALRAQVEEQSLAFEDAERDWKEFAAHAANKGAAELALADFYHRRVKGAEEVAALEAAAAVPSSGAEKFVAADKQKAWGMFPRALSVAKDQALGDEAVLGIERAWVARYPAEPVVRAQMISALMEMRRYDEAQKGVAVYEASFPSDKVFPLKATAALALARGDAGATTRALDLFDKGYQPLWPDELVQSYMQLLNATRTQHAMLANARAALMKNADDLNAVTRIFYYYRREGRMDAASNALAEYRASKEGRHAAWTADELYTFATLLERGGQIAEAARYEYALAEATGKLSATAESPAEAGLSGMIRMLLASSGDGIDLGSGNLSIYRDMATIDQGPGYLNGVLSLWLNSETPEAEAHDEEMKAAPYFHRAKAVELLAVLDQKFPAAAERASLHADLIRAYVGYGQDAAVREEGTRFLAAFPHAEERMEVAMHVADADAQLKDTKGEFAVYDSLLTEMSAGLQGMPLTAGSAVGEVTAEAEPVRPGRGDVDDPDATADEDAASEDDVKKKATAASDVLKGTFTLPVAEPPTSAAAAAYKQVLERYLGRLVATEQFAAALGVLRRELDRNPDDPMMYERLADFLAQNNMSAGQEEVYQKAIARFNDTSFYDKLARFYLREKRQQDYDSLSRKVVDIFAGTELEAYFANVNGPWTQETLQLNLYAHKRFPHDLMFTRNLLSIYSSKESANPAAWEQLMREHWTESAELQAEFFDYLGRTGKLDAELKTLAAMVPASGVGETNPAATRELADIHLWQSHFELSAPLLGELAAAYPADVVVGEPAASVYRSLAYYDPAQIDRAVTIEKNLWESDPGGVDRLATVGDIYADSTSTALNLDAEKQLAQASPYWKRMSAVHPGDADGYLQSATVFWDYFEFDEALAQIEAGRKQLAKPALYGYQAGAIYENKRDYARAVAEYVAAAMDEDDSNASGRLLELAGRAEFAGLVDKATESAVERHPTLAALELRDNVLSAQKKTSNLSALVESAIAKADDADHLAELAEFSQRHKLGRAYAAAVQRELGMTQDPVRRIELQYELVRAYDDQGNAAEAQKIVESVHEANPRIVGVVRTTIDFYWNHKQPQKAIAALTQASREANAKLALDFTLEAVNKSNQSGDYVGARALLKPLLAAEPYDARYVSLEADSFALAHDAAGLKDFYAGTLASLKAAAMSAQEKNDKTAMARQGMITALTELKDYAGAVDQHIALVSAFPEDDTILQSAAAYARLYGREAQLVGFLNTTVVASPQDSRFAIDLGRVDVLFEDYDGALAAYSKAIAIRKDRVDLYVARVDIEEHQQSFDAACADYERLYLLSYKDAQWMEKDALARAREGKPELAVKALETAWIEGRPTAASNYFQVAEELEGWGMLAQAQPFVEKGVALAGDDLLVNGEGLNTYVQLMGRKRKAPEAMDALLKMLVNVGSSPWAPAVVMAQVQQKGLAALTDEDWRKQRVERRKFTARDNFRKALQELSSVAATYYTPEEKLAYAKLLDARSAGRPAQEMMEVWIPAAHTAEVLDREAAWRREVLLHGGDAAQTQLQPYDSLEASRMDNKVRAETLEVYAESLKGDRQMQALGFAENAWREAGDRTQDVRLLRRLVAGNRATQYRARLFEMLMESDPAALMQIAVKGGADADAATEFLMEHGTDAQAYEAIAARAATRPAVWGNATTAVAGLYFADTSAKVDGAFKSVLDEATIGERLQAKPDKAKQLVGAAWFYYAMRYGVLLTLEKTPGQDADELLPAELEKAPHSSGSFYELAQAYRDARRFDAAIAEYRHVEELEPKDATPNVEIAETLWTMGRTDAAVAEWTHALTKLRATVDVKTVPESFWTNFAAIANDTAEHGLGAKLKPQMNVVLEAYIRKNKDYRSHELLRAAYGAVEKQGEAEAVAWVLALITDAEEENSQLALLSDLANPGAEKPWFPESHYDEVYRRELTLAQAIADAEIAAQRENGNTGSGQDYTGYRVTEVRAQYLGWMLSSGKVEEAQRFFDGLAASEKKGQRLQEIGLELAARGGRLATVVAGFASDPDNAPSLSLLVSVASDLRKDKDYAGSRVLMEYVFAQKLRKQKLQETDYVALAEARMDDGDLPGTLNLLHRLTLMGDLYTNLDTAATLLERKGHEAEALPLLMKLSHGVPWNQGYKLRLGMAQAALKQNGEAASALALVAGDDNASYEDRTTAAEALHGVGSAQSFSSGELTALASGTTTEAAADKPYYVALRLAVAKAASPARRGAMLRAALLNASTTQMDRLRLELFRSEMESGHYAQAEVAVRPLVAEAPTLFERAREEVMASGQEGATQNGMTDDSSTGTDDNSGDTSAFVASWQKAMAEEKSVMGLLNSEDKRREFLMQLAKMEEQLKDNGAAVRDLTAALYATSDEVELKKIHADIDRLKARMTMDAENAARRPVIQPSVEQKVLVRPRLVAETAKVSR